MRIGARSRIEVAGEHWRELTLEAHARHAAKEHLRARRLYLAARTEAEAVLARELRQPTARCIIGPILLTISHHNLAHLARDIGRPGLCSRYTIEAFERLVGIAEAQELPMRIRAGASKCLRPALEELLADLRARQQAVGAQPLIERARAAALMVQQAEADSLH